VQATSVLPRSTLSPVERPWRVSTLGKLAMGGLVANAALLVVMMAAVIGEFIPPVAVFAAVGLVFAGLIATGWRWTPILAVLYGALLVLVNAEGIAESLSQPVGLMFQAVIGIVGLAVFVLIAGVAGAIQNYRLPAGERRLPGWVGGILAGIVGICLGMIVLAGLPRDSAAAALNLAALNGLPTITVQNFDFQQHELHVKVGQTVVLRFQNGDRLAHTFNVDELGVETPIPPSGTGVAIFKPTQAGTYTFYRQPHYDKVSGQGMHGTLVVDP